MTLQRPQAAHLLAMGIDVYRPRPQPQPSRALQDPPQPRAWVVVEGEPTLQLDPGDGAGELLCRILGATGHPPAEFAIWVLGHPPPLPPAGLPQIWFTDRPVAATNQLLALPALAAIATDASQKKLAWQRLKPWLPNLERP